jgi:3-phenylpropionate/trans-cinnamate dioxygenase ferredoxin reductase subunit
MALRRASYSGSITLVGDEPHLPYERPPLSKDYLAGDIPAERIALRPAQYWKDEAVSFRLNERVVSVDPARQTVQTTTGALDYGSLVWATGGTPRRLDAASHNLRGVHVVRTRGDVDEIRSLLPTVERVVVIGGGYVGLEVAAVLTKLGKSVTLLEALDRVLARVAGAEISSFFEQLHRARGIDVRTSVVVDSLVGQDGGVTGVQLAGGRAIEADLVIVGIGIAPAVAPLVAAGARHGNGVEVDDRCRTSLPNTYAVGDCAAHRNRHADGAWVRLESVQNATDQAVIAASNIMGQDIAYDAVPWFWSNQYDVRLQTVGLSAGFDETVVRGSMTAGEFSVVYLRSGRVIALDCVNRSRDFMHGKRLVADRRSVDRVALADPSVPLKALST